MLFQVEEPSRDEFLFPMNRLPATSPESDVEYGRTDDDEMVKPRRLVRSSSDPSLAVQENIPGIPPYPNPPGYPRDDRMVSI